ncbi:hypothetical protein IPdc08_00653 [archaeon]|nr:hypothetical protein IPdc08_00653 [archaeon]
MTVEISTHLIAVMFVVVVAVFVPSFLVMEHISNAAIDKSLADQAATIAAAANTLSGDGSGISLNVLVPARTYLKILPGSVEFRGLSLNNSIPANINCNVTLTPGAYNVNLKFVKDNVTCYVVRQK